MRFGERDKNYRNTEMSCEGELRASGKRLDWKNPRDRVKWRECNEGNFRRNLGEEFLRCTDNDTNFIMERGSSKRTLRLYVTLTFRDYFNRMNYYKF